MCRVPRGPRVPSGPKGTLKRHPGLCLKPRSCRPARKESESKKRKGVRREMIALGAKESRGPRAARREAAPGQVGKSGSPKLHRIWGQRCGMRCTRFTRSHISFVSCICASTKPAQSAVWAQSALKCQSRYQSKGSFISSNIIIAIANSSVIM